MRTPFQKVPSESQGERSHQKTKHLLTSVILPDFRKGKIEIQEDHAFSKVIEFVSGIIRAGPHSGS